MAKRLRLIAYIRVSVVGEREKDGESFRSPDLQRNAINGIVATMGDSAEIVHEIKDLNKSGGTMDRPGLNEAMAMLAAGQADGIVVARLDRFARTTRGIDVIEQLDGDGKVFISAADRFDTSTAFGVFALGMMILVAKLERDRHVENIDVLNGGKIAEGVHIIVPYGYRRSDGKGSRLKADPSTAPVVQRIFAAAIAGTSPTNIARALNGDGIPAKKGGKWNKQAVAAVLVARSYLGEAAWGEYAFPGAHDQLVSDEDFEAAQRPKDGRDYSGRATRGNGQFLLSGLVRCAGCGHVMTSSSHSAGKRFRCTRDHADGTCPAPTSAFMEPLDDIVATAFLERHSSRAVRGAKSDDDLAKAQALAARRRTAVARWRDDEDSREELGEDSWREGLVARNRAAAEADEALARKLRKQEAAGLVVTPDEWAGFDTSERQKLLRASIASVEVTRAASTRAALAPRVRVRFAADADDDAPGVIAAVA